MIREFSRLKNINVSYQRIFQVYGDGENEKRFWPSLRKAALSGDDFHMSQGDQIRDFIDVKDVARKLFHAYEKLTNNSDNFIIENIGNGKGIKLKNFAKQWWEKFEGKGSLIFGERELRVTDFKRIVAEILE